MENSLSVNLTRGAYISSLYWGNWFSLKEDRGQEMS